MPCKCAICGYKKGITEDFMKWTDIPGLRTELYPVTKGGKPNTELLNFICARCLHHANSMKLFIKTLITGLVVTKHAINRFAERTGSDIHDKEICKIAIQGVFQSSKNKISTWVYGNSIYKQ